MRVKEIIKRIIWRMTKGVPRKEDYTLKGGVKLYWSKMISPPENLGDYLSTVVTPHFVPNLTKGKRGKTLFSIGSILGFRCQNAVVWGSGILNESPVYLEKIKLSSLDIRAVRGPKTRKILLEIGIDCPEVYGDPAVLMPYIYQPKKTDKKYKVSVVLHYEFNKFNIPQDIDIHFINIRTTDYETFIDEIAQSEVVISSSLHGIILSETYGTPAILMREKEANLFKYDDWYHSTGRYDVKVARSIKEAVSMQPMPLPDLTKMQQNLIEAFPEDLWW